MADKIRIFVADDHPIVREGLITILETQEDFEIVGEAADGESVLKSLPETETDILFLDLGLPKMDGVEVIRSLQANGSSVRVIVFTVFDTDERIMGAIKAGARGYLLKGASKEEIFQAVRTVHAGGSLLQPIVAARLFDHISDPAVSLSPRELEVLTAMAHGYTNKEIADQLFISERTVKFHVSSILGKLDAQNRTTAVQLALKRGLISLSP